MLPENTDPCDALGHLIDALVEHDVSDPNLGPPECWPWWCDMQSWTIGPDPDDGDDFEPSPEDCDALERITLERRYGCNARWI